MARPQPVPVHLVTGGFPPGAPAAHDIDFARRRLLEWLGEDERARVTVSSDLADIERWLPRCDFVVTYVAGPYLDDQQSEAMRAWLESGGRWFALHGTSGGRAAPVDGDRWRRQMVKTSHHAVLGAFFLNHPPVRRFTVDVEAAHPLAQGLPGSFETIDELYLIELQDPEHSELLLTTELEKDPSPAGFGFVYERDTSALSDGRTRALGYTRRVGEGAVTYVALGHCHSPSTNGQPFVDPSVDPEGKTPPTLRGSWENPHFETLVRNALAWGLDSPRPASA
jgi:type 1 glutamine amidotransferase